MESRPANARHTSTNRVPSHIPPSIPAVIPAKWAANSIGIDGVIHCAAHHPPSHMPITIPMFPPVNMARTCRLFNGTERRRSHSIAALAESNIPSHMAGRVSGSEHEQQPAQ